MKYLILSLLLISRLATAQDKPTTTPPAVVSLISGITDKQFEPDTVFTALSEEDETVLAKEPVANWGLAQTSGENMMYYNLIVGTRSYQLLIARPPKSSYPMATLLRYTTPKSKPEPIARGALKPKTEEKSK